jgi:type VI secretion system protein ImpE
MGRAEESFRAGNLAASLQELQAEIRQHAADPKRRIFLAQLLMLLGQWDRAVTQLDVLADMDSAALPMARAYRSAIECEMFRARVFAGERSPLVFGDPEPWIAPLLTALALENQGKFAEASEMRGRALEEAPATSGTLNGAAFEWIADSDTRLGPIMEVLLNGTYYWVPVHRIARIAIEAPSDARDLVWLPAQFTWTNQGEAMGFIPARYPGSESIDDDAIRMARKTDWTEVAPQAFHGLGQRLLTTDAAEYGLLEVREIVLAPAASGVAA